MRRSFEGTQLVILCAALIVVSCSNQSSKHYTYAQTATPASTVASPAPIKASSDQPFNQQVDHVTSPIRRVDFSRMDYPNVPYYRYPGDRKHRKTLKAGEGVPSYINYGELTGDKVEEAIVVISLENEGSAIPHYVYIFGFKGERISPIWDFETGDRGDGGLRQVYSQDGKLVVELFGKNRILGRDLYLGDGPLCCPKEFTRTYYEWDGKGFRVIGDAEVVPNTAGDAAPIMPSYH